LLHGLQVVNYSGRVFLSVQQSIDAETLTRQGASAILKPFDDAADYAVRQLIETGSETAEEQAGRGQNSERSV